MDLNGLHSNEIEQLRGLLNLVTKLGGVQVTLEKFREEYLKYLEMNRSEAYLVSNRISLNHMEKYFKPQRILNMITFREVELFITDLRGKMGEGYRVYYRNLKAAFNKAVEWNYISNNPFLKIRLPKKQKNQPAYITESELEKILEKIEIKVVRDIAYLSFYTGCRLSEIINLKWENVKIDERTIIIGDEEFKTKGRNQRTIPLSDKALDIIMNVTSIRPDKSELLSNRILIFRQSSSITTPHSKSGFVFSKVNSERFTGDYISKKFKEGCRKAKVSERVHFHSLRHSFASNLAQKGVSIYIIQKLLGHSSVTTTEVYSHLNIDGLRDAINVFDTQSQRLVNQ